MKSKRKLLEEENDKLLEEILEKGELELNKLNEDTNSFDLEAEEDNFDIEDEDPIFRITKLLCDSLK